MIAITGATGQLGQLVISGLLKTVPASQIAAVVRNPAKAANLAALGVNVREASYDDEEALAAAFQGVEKVLLISSSEVGQRLPQHRNVIKAAQRAGVSLLAYTSLLHASDSPLALASEHVATEELLRASGLRHTILRNGWYIENYTGNLAAALAHGVILGSAQDGRISAAARADYADAAAAVLTASGTPDPVYELAGEQSFSLAELAAEVSRQAGKPVVYKDLPEREYEAALLGVGLPDWLASLLSNSDAGAARGALEDRSGTLSRLIGRPTATLAEAVAAGIAG